MSMSKTDPFQFFPRYVARVHEIYLPVNVTNFIMFYDQIVVCLFTQKTIQSSQKQSNYSWATEVASTFAKPTYVG